MYKISKQNVCYEICSYLQVGDYVFAKIVIPNGFDFYVPAIVIALPNHAVAEDQFYTVLKCNNRRVSRLLLRNGLSHGVGSGFFDAHPPRGPRLTLSWHCRPS